jgi:hypothetical protein
LLQFVSIHSYSSNAAGAYSLSSLESTASSYGRANMPVFLTEWNYTYSSNTNSPQVVGNQVVTWMSSQMILLSTQPQLTGADYFSFLPDNEELSAYEDCSGCDNYKLAFYSGNDGVATLLPQARVYQLFSVAMGLGGGAFKVFSTSSGAAAQGFINSKREVVAAVVNTSSLATTANVSFNNIQVANACDFSVYLYVADTVTNNAINPVSTASNQCITSKTMTLTDLDIPANATLGILVIGP